MVPFLALLLCKNPTRPPGGAKQNTENSLPYFTTSLLHYIITNT